MASLGKMKVSSIGGTIVDTNVANENKFYMRECLYSKFKYILESELYCECRMIRS